MANDKHDELDNQLYEAYRQYLEGRSAEELIEHFRDMTKKQLMDFIQELDPVGKGDGCYET